MASVDKSEFSGNQFPDLPIVTQICFDLGSQRICIPFGSGPVIPFEPIEVQLPNNLRNLALSAGVIHGEFLRLQTKLMRKAKFNVGTWIKLNIERLVGQNKLSKYEGDLLGKIGDLLVALENNNEYEPYIKEVRSLFEHLCDEDGSELSISLAAIALNSTQNAAVLGANVNADRSRIGPATSDFGSGLAGAGAGLLGGLAGVLLGGIYGAAAGTLAWAIDRNSSSASSTSGNYEQWFKQNYPHLNLASDKSSVFLSGLQCNNLQQFARSAGEYHGMLFRSQLIAFGQANRELISYSKKGLSQLESDDYIDSWEHSRLLELLHIVNESSDTQFSKERLRSCEQKLRIILNHLVDSEANPVGIMIAEVAVNSIENELFQTLGVPSSTQRGGVAEKDVAGAIAGAAIGGKLGGGWGAVAGGILGGGGFSFAQWIDNQNPSES